METIVNFLRDNWQFISSAILALLSILAIVLKRKSKNVLLTKELYEKALDGVLKAEELFGSGHGAEKKEYVMELLRQSFGYSGKDFDWLDVVLDNVIENILLSPQKKGVKIDGKK